MKLRFFSHLFPTFLSFYLCAASLQSYIRKLPGPIFHTLAINSHHYSGSNFMPQSLVLHLVTQSAVLPSCLQGHAMQQLFFDLVDVVDPELGHVLRHDRRNRSYSLSTLQINETPANETPPRETLLPNESEITPSPSNLRLLPKSDDAARPTQSLFSSRSLRYSHSQAIAPNTECWWRISFLDDALFDHLIFLWNQLSDDVFQLGSSSVKIVRLISELPGFSWVSSCSYRDIYEQASAYERDIRLQFVTPTAFETMEGVTPLPTTDAIFQPLRKYWNCYSGLVFAPSLVSHIIPINFDIKTQVVQRQLKRSMHTFTGCTGEMSFRVGGKGDPLITKRINTLAEFTRYCPIGLNMQFGMGVIRRLGKARMAAQQSQVN